MTAAARVELGGTCVTDQLGNRADVERSEHDLICARERRAFAGALGCDNEQSVAATHGELQPREGAPSGEVDVVDDDDRWTTGRGALDDREEVGEQCRLSHRGIDHRRRAPRIGSQGHRTEQRAESPFRVTEHGVDLVSGLLAEMDGETIEHRLQRQLTAELVTPAGEHERCGPRAEPTDRAPRSCRCRLRLRARRQRLRQP